MGPKPRGGGGKGPGARVKTNNGKNGSSADGGSRPRLISECDDDHCPVCLNRIKIFAVGMCDHPVCSECSARMRVLCQQNECPICRQDLPKVIQTLGRKKFKEIEHNPYQMDKRYRICFENVSVANSYYALLEHKCPLCRTGEAEEDGEPKEFRNIKQLDLHIRRKHEMFFCDLCLKHLTIFTHERRVYSRTDLATHRRKGDFDDKSHKGHPNCEFCNTRFLDKDELFKHLRKDHYFCHFCDADGLQYYFPDYPHLRDHFDSEHFLCKEGNCYDEQFTSAFRSEIDLKAHMSDRHRDGLSKAAQKQNRVVDVDLNYSRAQKDNYARPRRQPRGGNNYENDDSAPREAEPPAPSASAPDLLTEESFPTLGSSGTTGSVSSSGVRNDSAAKRLALSSGRNSNWSDGRKRPDMEEDFPSLPGSNTSRGSIPVQPYNRTSGKPTNSAMKKQSSPVEDFPSLSSTSKPLQFSKQTSVPSCSPTYRSLGGGVVKSWAASDIAASKVEQRPKQVVSSKPLTQSDFPGLTKKSNGNIFNDTSALTKKKKKSEPPKKKVVEQSNLKSAADLISVKPKTVFNQDSRSQVKPKADLDQGKVQRSDDNDYDFHASKIGEYESTEISFSKVSLAQAPPPESPRLINNRNDKKHLSSDNFPGLGPSSKQMSAHFRPIKLNEGSAWSASKPNNVIQNQSKGNKPPPGFDGHKNKTLEHSAKNFNNNNNNNAPPGFEKKKPVNFQYQQPRDFSLRNNSLLTKCAELLGGGKSMEFTQFKKFSSEFKEGKISCEQFYNHCQELMDRDNKLFMEIFPELLILLPNIKKQQELLAVHKKTSPNFKFPIAFCETCQQIVSPPDLNEHRSTHVLDDDFPSLM